jgi:hypothetical protein
VLRQPQRKALVLEQTLLCVDGYQLLSLGFQNKLLICMCRSNLENLLPPASDDSRSSIRGRG